MAWAGYSVGYFTISTTTEENFVQPKEFGLSGEEVQSLTVLRKLRNKIAHSADRSLTWDDAIRFRRAAERLLAKMKANWEELRKK